MNIELKFVTTLWFTTVHLRNFRADTRSLDEFLKNMRIIYNVVDNSTCFSNY